MYQWIARNIAEGMLSSEFRISSALGNGQITEDSPILLLKQESPVLYVACILNAQKTDLLEHQKFMANFLSHLEKNLSDYFCSRIICLSIAVDNEPNENTAAFLTQQEFFPSGISYHIWWNAIASEKTIIAGTGMPTKILNIQDIVISALKNPRQLEDISLRRLEKSVLDKTTPKAKASNTQITYSLIFINGLIILWMVLFDKSEQWISHFATSQAGVFEHHEYYRLVTSFFLHVSLMHFLQNSIYIYFFGTRTEILFGKAKMLFIYMLSGLGSSLLSVAFQHGRSVGASGAAFGLMGAILVYSRIRGQRSIGMNYTSLLLWVIVGILFGFLTPNVDNLGHIGGFLTGAVSAWIILYTENQSNPHSSGDKKSDCV